jgi:hypothetical protein
LPLLLVKITDAVAIKSLFGQQTDSTGKKKRKMKKTLLS